VQTRAQSTPRGGTFGSFVTVADMVAVAFVIRVEGGAVANLMVTAVEAVIVIIAVDDEDGFAVDAAVIVTLGGLPPGIVEGAV
jgi:hypothetical protein